MCRIPTCCHFSRLFFVILLSKKKVKKDKIFVIMRQALSNVLIYEPLLWGNLCMCGGKSFGAFQNLAAWTCRLPNQGFIAGAK